MIYLRLFYEYFKAGLFAIGGGMATVPFLQDISRRTAWFTEAELADMLAVSESTPGPVGVNMATYVGFTTGGPLGSIAATLGLITPSIIVILIISGILAKFRENRFVTAGFYGLRPASLGLITAAFVSIVMISFCGEAWDHRKLILAVALLAVIRFVKPAKKLHPLVWIVVSAVVGIVFKFT